jgi:hypothetical protein
MRIERFARFTTSIDSLCFILCVISKIDVSKITPYIMHPFSSSFTMYNCPLTKMTIVQCLLFRQRFQPCQYDSARWPVFLGIAWSATGFCFAPASFTRYSWLAIHQTRVHDLMRLAMQASSESRATHGLADSLQAQKSHDQTRLCVPFFWQG